MTTIDTTIDTALEARLVMIGAQAGVARHGTLPADPLPAAMGVAAIRLPDNAPAVLLLGTCADRWFPLVIGCQDARDLADAFDLLAGLLPGQRTAARVIGPEDAAARTPQVIGQRVEGFSVVRAGLAFMFDDDQVVVLSGALTVAGYQAPRLPDRD